MSWRGRTAAKSSSRASVQSFSATSQSIRNRFHRSEILVSMYLAAEISAPPATPPATEVALREFDHVYSLLPLHLCPGRQSSRRRRPDATGRRQSLAANAERLPGTRRARLPLHDRAFGHGVVLVTPRPRARARAGGRHLDRRAWR